MADAPRPRPHLSVRTALVVVSGGRLCAGAPLLLLVGRLLLGMMAVMMSQQGMGAAGAILQMTGTGLQPAQPAREAGAATAAAQAPAAPLVADSSSSAGLAHQTTGHPAAALCLRSSMAAHRQGLQSGSKLQPHSCRLAALQLLQPAGPMLLLQRQRQRRPLLLRLWQQSLLT